MADFDANLPQVNDPAVETDLIRLLQITGPLGRLNVLDTVVPVVFMGNVVPQTITVLQPAFRATDVFSNGIQTAAAINTIHADTGALAAGTYDCKIKCMGMDAAARNNSLQLQHRDAANAANLAVWDHMITSNTNREVWSRAGFYDFAYEIALNERLRILNTIAVPASQTSYALLFARRRT